MSKKAIVVGAGLAGLTAGYQLEKAGWSVDVLEATGQPGGRVATVDKQGYRFDSGAVGTGTVYTDYMDLLEELGLNDKIREASTVSGFVRDGKIHEIDSAKPMSGVTTKLFSWASKLSMIKLAIDILKVKKHINIRDVASASQYDTESARDYALRRLNREIADILIEPMIRTLNLSRSDKISKLELFNALTGLFDTTMITLEGGLGLLPDTMASHLNVQLNSPATSITRNGSSVEVTWRNANGEEQKAQYDACVLATTLPKALELYEPAQQELAPLGTTLTYNRGLAVHLGYNKPTNTKALMAMMPIADSKEISLFFFEHNKGPDRAPPGHSTITVFFDDVALDDVLEKPEQQLVSETAAFVEKIMPELAGGLAMSHVSNWGSEGLSHPGIGVFRAMDEVNKKLDRKSPVQYAGDYFSTAGQNSAIVYGKRAAENIVNQFSANA